jgi:hypothetical protein
MIQGGNMIVFKNKPHSKCVIRSPFGWRIHPIKKVKSMHWGVDIARITNKDPLFAVNEGVVRVATFNAGGYGFYIVIEHDGFCTLYGHMPKLEVHVGQKVKAGERVGTMGTTGGSTGIHLHFEVWNTSFNPVWDRSKNVDPAPYIRGVDNKPMETIIKEVQDNTPDTWAKISVDKAIAKGIFKGDSDGNLRLHDEITRQEFMVILDRLSLLK